MIHVLKQRFLDYHQAKGFKIYESFPLVIDDPTILFTNATVSPFKTMFTGAKPRHNFALVQQCLRLGGSGGNLDTPRTNLNHTSLFEMIGAGLFDVGHDSAVEYFIEVLVELGLPKERLVFSTLTGLGFDESLLRAGIAESQIRLFSDADKLPHEWSFGEGDLHGCGVVARFVPESARDISSDSVLEEFSHYVEIGRIVHLDGVTRGTSVEKSDFSAYDLGIGLNRVETALKGDCEGSLSPWRDISAQLCLSIPQLSSGDAHYMANLFCIARALVGEGLLPGRKKQAFVLRKVIRKLIEEFWVQSGSLVKVSGALGAPIGASDSAELLMRVFDQEEEALRKILSSAKAKQRKHPEMSAEQLRGTFGIPFRLLEL